MESSELMRIRDDYKKKIEEIEHDHYEALAPVIGRMQVSHSLFVLRIEHIYVRMIICVQFGVDFWAYFLIFIYVPSLSSSIFWKVAESKKRTKSRWDSKWA